MLKRKEESVKTIIPVLRTSKPIVLTVDILKAILAHICEVRATNLTISSSSVTLLSALCSAILKEGDEIIVCEHRFPLRMSRVFFRYAFPIVVRGGIDNIMAAIGPRTKLVYLLSNVNYIDVTTIRKLRSDLPKSVTLVVDFGFASFVSPFESKVTGNVITIRTVSLESLNIGWMHIQQSLTPVEIKLQSPFVFNETQANIIRNEFRWNVCAVRNSFWRAKMVSQIRSNQLTLGTEYSNCVTFSLVKRLPLFLIQSLFTNTKTDDMAISNIFNTIKLVLTNANDNNNCIKLLPSVKTTCAVIKSMCTRPCGPSHTT